MATEDNKAIVVRLLTQWFNEGDMAVWDALVRPDVVIHGVAADLHGAAQAQAFYASLTAALHPLRFTIDDVIAEGDQVVVRLTESGTMVGSFLGQPPTGKQYTIPAVQICRLVDGQLAEMWGFRDTGAQLRQLGLAAPGAPVGAGPR